MVTCEPFRAVLEGSIAFRRGWQVNEVKTRYLYMHAKEEDDDDHDARENGKSEIQKAKAK